MDGEDSDAESVISQQDDDVSIVSNAESNDEEDDDETLGDLSDAESDANNGQTTQKPEGDGYEYDSEEEEDDDYLEKFDETIRKSVIETYHPEAKSVNHEEMIKMAKVTRDERGIIVDDLHRTIPMMTKYEYTTILGQRAQQIDEGDTPLVRVPHGVMDGYLIAQMELEQKRIPFIIKRPIPGSGFEYWHVEDLEIVHEPLH